jgi:hypothetical protein
MIRGTFMQRSTCGLHFPASASDSQFESQRLSGNNRQGHGRPLFGTVTGTRRPKGLSWARIARRRRRLKPLTDLSAGAQEPLFQIMAACASPRQVSSFGGPMLRGHSPIKQRWRSLNHSREPIFGDRSTRRLKSSSQTTGGRRPLRRWPPVGEDIVRLCEG